MGTVNQVASCVDLWSIQLLSNHLTVPTKPQQLFSPVSIRLYYVLPNTLSLGISSIAALLSRHQRGWTSKQHGPSSIRTEQTISLDVHGMIQHHRDIMLQMCDLKVGCISFQAHTCIVGLLFFRSSAIQLSCPMVEPDAAPDWRLWTATLTHVKKCKLC